MFLPSSIRPCCPFLFVNRIMPNVSNDFLKTLYDYRLLYVTTIFNFAVDPSQTLESMVMLCTLLKVFSFAIIITLVLFFFNENNSKLLLVTSWLHQHRLSS